jgi:hypothetical protein
VYVPPLLFLDRVGLINCNLEVQPRERMPSRLHGGVNIMVSAMRLVPSALAERCERLVLLRGCRPVLRKRMDYALVDQLPECRKWQHSRPAAGSGKPLIVSNSDNRFFWNHPSSRSETGFAFRASFVDLDIPLRVLY